MRIRPIGAYLAGSRGVAALSKRRDHAIIKAIVAIIGLVPGAVADIVIGAPNDLVRASGRDSGNERAHRKADGRRANGRTGNGAAAAVPAAAAIIMIDHRWAMEAPGINTAGVPAIESRKDPVDCKGFFNRNPKECGACTSLDAGGGCFP